MSKQDGVPILSFNKQTGYYEGLLLIQVDAEIFRRMLLRAIEEDETSDLTDPQTFAAVATRIGEIARWVGRPQVKVTPIAKPVAVLPVTKAVVLPRQSQKPTYAEIEAELREKAPHVPPSQWGESLMTPIIEGANKSPEKQRCYYIRSDQRRVLKQLREEWEQGLFLLDADAAEREQRYQGKQQERLEKKVEIVATTTNGARLR